MLIGYCLERQEFERSGEETNIVAFRSAKENCFRGAKADTALAFLPRTSHIGRMAPAFHHCLRLGLSILGLLAAWASAVSGQDPALPPSGTSPLGVRQQRVERMIEDLERKFKSLKLAIQEKEPERAERLQQALNKSKELLLEKRMDDITRLLDQTQLDQASDGQKTLIADLRELLVVLLDEQGGRDDAKEKMEILGQWKKEIQKLTLLQRDEKAASEQLAAKPQPPAAFEEHSQKQQALANQTSELAQQMQSRSANASQPGQANLSKAQQAMQAASGQLGKQNAANAARDQQQALNELDVALSEVDAALNELRDAAELQSLADLEKRFREMLATQQKLTAQTTALEQKRIAAAGQLTRADRNQVRIIGEEERRLEPSQTADGPQNPGLAGQAQQAAEILENGGAANLAQVVAGLRDGFFATGKLLADDLQTGPATNERQTHLETSLQNLIAALQKAQSDKQQSMAQSQAPGGKQPGPEGSSGQQSEQPSAQGGKKGGGSKGTDKTAATPTERSAPQSPWSQLRDKERDPVYSAIKEKFPARYQQLIEQYYRSFEKP